MEENESKIYSKVPAKISPWSNVKSFFMKPVQLDLTPYEKKVFNEVKNFWMGEIYFDKGFHFRMASNEVNNQVSPTDSEEPNIKIGL